MIFIWSEFLDLSCEQFVSLSESCFGGEISPNHVLTYMATLASLTASGALVKIEVPLGLGDCQKRQIYGFPSFRDWLDSELPGMVPGRLKSVDPPKEQVDWLLYKWITGGRILYGRQFQDLMPDEDEVWEMKTADTRIFGWIYRPLIFIALFGDYADLYKPPTKLRSYKTARQRVMTARDNLKLDEPKFSSGSNFDELVSI